MFPCIIQLSAANVTSVLSPFSQQLHFFLKKKNKQTNIQTFTLKLLLNKCYTDRVPWRQFFFFFYAMYSTLCKSEPEVVRESMCKLCSQGCMTEVHSKGGDVYIDTVSRMCFRTHCPICIIFLISILVLFSVKKNIKNI